MISKTMTDGTLGCQQEFSKHFGPAPTPLTIAKCGPSLGETVGLIASPKEILFRSQAELVSGKTETSLNLIMGPKNRPHLRSSSACAWVLGICSCCFRIGVVLYIAYLLQLYLILLRLVDVLCILYSLLLDNCHIHFEMLFFCNLGPQE